MVSGVGGLQDRRTALAHQLLSNPQPTVRPHDAQAGDVAMRHAVRRVLLHLGQDIAHDLGIVVGRLLGAGDVDGHEAELGP